MENKYYTGQEKEILLAVIDIEIESAKCKATEAASELEFWQRLRKKFYGE